MIYLRKFDQSYIFVRTDRFDNTGTLRRLPYTGIQCWCIYENDLDKYINELELWGGDRNDIRIIDAGKYDKLAVDYKQAHDYVMGNSDQLPKLEKFNADKHIMRFTKQPAKSMLDYIADMKYQILLT